LNELKDSSTVDECQVQNEHGVCSEEALNEKPAEMNKRKTEKMQHDE